MPAAFQTGEGFQTGDGSAPTPTAPSGLTAGDLLLWKVSYEKGTDIAVTLPSGFTLVGTVTSTTNIGLTVARKIAAGGDSLAGSFNAAAKYSAVCSRFTGHDGTTPVRASAATSNGSSGNPDPPAAANEVADDLILYIVAGKTQTTYTAPSGYTERYDRPNSASGIPGHSMGDRVALGSSEDPGAVVAASQSEWAAITVAIAPGVSQLAPPRSMQQYRRRRS